MTHGPWRRAARLARRAFAHAGVISLLLRAAAGANVLAPDPSRAIGQVIAFDGFVDQFGRPFSAARDEPRAWIVSPMYTRCPTTCSALTAALQAALRQSALRSTDYRVLSFSFDLHESDASLAEFRQRMQLPPEWITLRTADPAALERTLRALDLRTMQLDDGRIDHPNLVAVLDGGQRVVGYVNGLPLSSDTLARTVTRARDGASALDRWRPFLFLLAAVGFAASAAFFVAMISRRSTHHGGSRSTRAEPAAWRFVTPAHSVGHARPEVDLGAAQVEAHDDSRNP
jgi:cytochrome oxidase Cu insertion factor (SCO1/SenC/PrrC family)